MNGKALFVCMLLTVVTAGCGGGEVKMLTQGVTSAKSDRVANQSPQTRESSADEKISNDTHLARKHLKQVDKSSVGESAAHSKYRRVFAQINGPGCNGMKCAASEVCVSKSSSGHQTASCVEKKLADLRAVRGRGKRRGIGENSAHVMPNLKQLEQKVRQMKAEVHEFEMHREKKQQKRLQWIMGDTSSTSKTTVHQLVLDMQNDATGRTPLAECRRKELDQVGERLLDQFKQQQDEHNGRRKKEKRNSTKKELHEDDECICQSPVSWQFQRLDDDADGRLTSREMEALIADGSVNVEPHCLTAFVRACDHNGDLALSEKEWCCCFADVLPPCLSAMKMVPSILIGGLPSVIPGAFVPQCDDDGFYKPIQCDTNRGLCWCVDRNGHRLNGTTTSGTLDC